MSRIRLLSDQLINRIAAGEVVERPASALKELVENSLDAGADRIEIEAEAGGRKRIMVSDNGSGMSSDDLLLAVERHATSKLDEETDLLSIGTLGFRGEALPSIASVSRFSITSSDNDDGKGNRIRVSSGKVMGLDETARERGATVEVMDLFFNVPARRKFLKSVNTEAAHILEAAQRYALAHPALRLVYRHNGQEILATSPQEDDRTRIARVLGRQTAKGMFPFDGNSGDSRISGFLGRPEMDRSRSSSIYLYVNRRPVSDRLLIRAVMEAYRGRLAPKKYPVVILYLDLDPTLVDVNVHPAKAEVRFRRPGDTYNAVSGIIADALSATLRPLAARQPLRQDPQYRDPFDRQPQAPPPSAESFPEFQVREADFWSNQSPQPFEPPPNPPVRDHFTEPDTYADDPAPQPFAPTEPEPQLDLIPIGQLFNSYILAQGPDGLIVIDQHAAHERILYEKVQAQMDQGEMPGQGLLIPETFEVTPTQADGALAILPELNRLGFDLSHFGDRTFVLRAVPAVLVDRDYMTVLSEILESAESVNKGEGLDHFRRTFVSSVACHAAIKANRVMSVQEMDRLIVDLRRCRVPTNCPHGRPLIFSLDRREIEKRFHRA